MEARDQGFWNRLEAAVIVSEQSHRTNRGDFLAGRGLGHY